MNASLHMDTLGDIAHDAGAWLIGTALVFMILGIAAIVAPVVAGIAIAALVGGLLVLGGLTHIISIARRDDGGTVWHTALGLSYICGGVYFLMNPLIALEALTLLLAVLLFVEGGVDLVAYSAQKRLPGSTWLLVNAFVTAGLGTLLAMHWPAGSARAVGTIVGVNLMVTGYSRMMLGSAVFRVGHAAAA